MPSPKASMQRGSSPPWGRRLLVLCAVLLAGVWLRYKHQPEVAGNLAAVDQEEEAVVVEEQPIVQHTHRQEEEPASQEDPVKAFVDRTLKENRVVVFSKSYCGFSRKAKAAMGRNLPPESFLVVELDQREDGPQIQAYMRELTGGGTVPRVFIDQQFIGGGDDTEALDASGQLGEMLKAKGIA